MTAATPPRGDASQRPWAARAMALGVFLVPLLASVAVAVLVSRALPPARSWPQLAVWWVVLGTVATATLVVVDRIVIRTIPIPALHRLAQMFPDRGIRRKRAADLTDRALEDLPEPEVPGDDDLVTSLRALLVRLQRHDVAMAGHSQRVRRYSELIAEELELTPDETARLAWAALLHDVGKLGVPERALRRVGELAPDERAAVNEHPERSHGLTRGLHPWLGEWALTIGQHHERWDGTGYPDGLAGEGIALGARIVAVADAFDAMTGPRSYRPTISPQAGRAEIADGAGTAYDPEVVRAFLNISIRRLRVVAGGLTWGLQTRATGLVDTATRLATTGAAVVAAGAALAVGGTLEIPTLVRDTAPVAIPTPLPSLTESPTPEPDTSPSPTPPSPGPSPTSAGTGGVAVPVGPVAPPPVAPPPAAPAALLGATWSTSVPVGATLRPGDTLTVTFDLRNDGPDPATGVLATPSVPAGLRGVPGTVTVDGAPVGGSPFTSGIPIADVPVGGTVRISFTYEVPRTAGSGLIDPPTVTVVGPSGTTTFAAPGGFVLDATPRTGLQLTATPVAGATVVPGGRISYTATLANEPTAGGDEVGASLSATLPPGLTLDGSSVALDGTPVAPGLLATGIALPTLRPGDTVTVTFDGLVDSPQPDGTALTVVATMSGPPTPQSTAVTHIVDSAGAVTLTGVAQPAPGTVAPGTTLLYRFSVANDAAATATVDGLVITAPTPPGTLYVPGSTVLDGAPVPDASNPVALGLALPALPPGASTTVTFQATVSSPLPDGTVIDARADVTGGPAPLATLVSHVISSSPDLTFTLEPSRDPALPVTPGETISYRLTLTNQPTGTAIATGVRLSLPTPTDTTFVPGSAVGPLGATLPDATNPFTTTVVAPDLPPGTSTSIGIDVTVGTPLPAGTVLTAAGTATTTQVPGPLTATATHTVASTTDVSLTVVAVPPDGDPVVPGGTTRVTATIANGPAATATATGMALSSLAAAGLAPVPGSATLDGGPLADVPEDVAVALPDLPPGTSATVTWDLDVSSPQPNGTSLATTATLSGGTLPAPIAATVSHTVLSSTALSTALTAVPDPSTPITPGEVVAWTLTVTNDASATETATGVTMKLTPPAASTFRPGSAVGADGAALPDTTNPFATAFAVPDLPPGASAAISLEAVVDSPLPNGSPLTASGTTDSDQEAPQTRTVTHAVTSAPVIAMTVTATPPAPSSVVAGQAITYEVTASNDTTATENAVGVTLTLPTPQNTTFLANSAVDETGTTVTSATNPFASAYALPTLAPGDALTVSFTVVVDTPLPDGTPVDFFPKLGAIRLTAPLAETVSHLVTSSPSLSVTIEPTPVAGDPVAPGDVVTYVVTVANSPLATATATGIVLTAPDPDRGTYVDGSAVDQTGTTLTGTTTNPFAGGWPLPALAPGTQHILSFDARVDLPLPNGVAVRQTSQADSDQLTLPVVTAVEHTVTSSPDLSLVLTATPPVGGPVTPGDTVTYTATVTNSLAAGTETATGVLVTLPTPVDTTYVGGSAIDETGTGLPGAFNPFSFGWSLPDLAPGGSATVSFDVVVDRPLTDGALVTLDGTLDADQLATTLSTTATHTVSSAPALSIVLRSTPTEGGPVTPGDTVEYRVAVTNAGAATATATSVTLSLPTPAGTTYVAGSALDETGTPIAGATNPFAAGYALPDLAPGEFATLQLEVTVDSPATNGDTIAALASVTAAEVPTPLTDPADLIVSSSPVLSFAVTSSPPVSSTVLAGSTVTYTLRATNDTTATATATGLIVTGPTPTDTTYVAASAVDETGTTIGGAVNPFAAGYALPPLAPGSSWEVRFAVQVGAPLPDGTVVTEIASLDADQLVTALGAVASHTVSSSVVLSAQLDAVPVAGDAVTPGDTVRYLLTVTNDAGATATATGVTASLPTPARTTFVTNSAVDENGDPIVSATNPFAAPYALPDLAPGQSATLELAVVLAAPQPNGSTLSASATVDADQLATTLAPTAAHPISSSPALTIVTQSTPAEGSTITPGEVAGYEVTVTNATAATETATGVVITLPTPNDTKFLTDSAIDENGDPIVSATNPFATGYAVPPLAPGQSVTLAFQATVLSPLPNGTVLATTGSVDATQLGAPLTDPADLVVASTTAMTVSLVPFPPVSQTVQPTTKIAYELTATNLGAATATATGVTLTLPTPGGTTYVTDSARDEAGTTITGPNNPFLTGYPLPDLKPGDSWTITIAVEVLAGLGDGALIEQSGTLDVDQLTFSLIDAVTHTVEVHVASPFVDGIVISEVLYQETGPTLLDNDEAIELRNLSDAPIDIGGWTLADVDVLVGDTDTTGSFSTTFDPGTIVPAHGHLVVWLGVDQSGTKPGFTNLIGSLVPQWYVATTPSLDAGGDDVWLYDADAALVDRVAWGSGAQLAPAPPPTVAPWDVTGQAALAGAPINTSISSTPGTQPTDSAACYEHTGSGAAPGSATWCPTPPISLVEDAWPGRITSLGISNTFESHLFGAVTMTEILYAETYTLLLVSNDDEAIELYNPGPDTIDLTGWSLADGDLITGYTESSTFSHIFPNGTLLPPGEIGVVWVGVDNRLIDFGLTNVDSPVAFEQYGELVGPRLSNTSDDVWLYDPSLRVVDHVGWGTVGAQRSSPPPTAWWDPFADTSLAGAADGRSISLTPFATAVPGSSRCWELTASGAAGGDPLHCPTPPTTLDTDTRLGRINSVGDPNT